LTCENWPIYLINIEFWLAKWVNVKCKYGPKLA